ncbi:MAG: tubulin--tyrosine ligase family protein [Nannocystaceae bacterium]|nr:tubulin--tyrosine ligase family protein [Nannocystaceae bacterium]
MSGIWNRAAGRYYAGSGGTKMRRLLEHYGWIRVEDPSKADIVLLGSPRHLETVPVRPDQLVDCVEGTEQLTNKGRLATLLRGKPRTTALQPETFLVDDPEELRQLLACAHAEPEAVWIRKPLASGRGIGVEVLTDIQAWAKQRGEPSPGGELVQRYIDRPLLLEGTKSEIRSYVLVACTDPLLVLYHDGTVRLTSLPFLRGDWSNPLRHITNTYRQKEASGELWEQRGDGLKWTLGGLGEDVHQRGLTDDPRWVENTLRPGLIGMLHLVFAAAASKLRARPGAFQLLGMDTLLEDDLERMWLTEMQLGPGLSIDNPVKAKLIPLMLQEAISIVLEVNERLAAGDDPTQLTSRRHFQWVYRGTPATNEPPR